MTTASDGFWMEMEMAGRIRLDHPTRDGYFNVIEEKMDDDARFLDEYLVDAITPSGSQAIQTCLRTGADAGQAAALIDRRHGGSWRRQWPFRSTGLC